MGNTAAPRRRTLHRMLAVFAAVLALVTVTSWGGDRSADAIEPPVAIVYIARAFDFADALAGSVAASLNNAPILLVPGGTNNDVPQAVRTELTRLAPGSIVILGGPAAVSTTVENELRQFATTGSVTRVFGRTRIETAEAISRILPNKAANADLLDGLDASAFVTRDTLVEFRVALSFGEAEEFVTNGPVGLVAQCRENISADQDEARILAVTREDGAFMQGDTPHSGPGVNSNYLDVATPEDNRVMGGIVSAGPTPNAPAADDDIDTGFVLGPAGQYIGMDETTVYALRVGGSDCLFIGLAMVSS